MSTVWFRHSVSLLVALLAHGAIYSFILRHWIIAKRKRIFFILYSIAICLLEPILLFWSHKASMPSSAKLLYSAVLVYQFALLQCALATTLLYLLGTLIFRRRAKNSHKEAGENQVSEKENSEPSSSHHRHEAPLIERRVWLTSVGGAVTGALTGSTFAYGALKTRFDLEVTELPVKFTRLPRQLDGFSIVQVSDIHVGPFVGEHILRTVRDRVRSLRPDLIVMTGDLVHSQKRDADEALRWLRELKEMAPFGLYAIAGNHEYYVGRDFMFQSMKRAGAHVLFNSSDRVAATDNGGFVLAGLDDFYAYNPRLNGGPNAPVALHQVPQDLARILLCHNPRYHRDAMKHDVDLMLSGHTHGGQIELFGSIPVSLMYKHIRGLSQHGNMKLYVNRGIGTSGPPTRVFVTPEVSKIILHS